MARGFNLTAELNLRGPSNIRTIVADIRRQLGTINANVNVRLDPGVARNIGTLNQTFRAFNNTLQATNASANATAISLRTLGTAIQQVNNRASNLPANLQQINNATQNVAQQNAAATAAVHTTTSAFREFGQQSALAVRRFAAFATVTGVIYKVSSALSSATTDFITFNQELVRVSQVTDTSVKNLGGLVAEITSLSTKFGVSSNELIKVSSTLAQAGLSARDTEKALKALALSALAPSFDNLNSTVEGSIALMRQFGISAGELDRALGSVNAVAAKFAVEAGDIITAIQRTGGVFATASKGVSEGTQALNEFMAVFTSVRATTRESAETIATGLRTIFTRIQRGDTIDALKEYGVTLTDLQGKFVGPYEAVRRLSEGLSQLDPRDLKFSRIVEELGGFRQIGKVIPLIQQFATAQAALKVAQSGQDSLATDAATAQQSLAVQMAKVRNEFVGLVRSIGQSSGFQSFVKLSLDLTSNLIRLTDAAKGALPALGAIFAMRGLSAIGQFGRGFIGGMRPNRNSQGGPIRAFATGGHVPGYGDGDTVSARLTPGEFVMRKSAVRSIGVKTLNSLNKYGVGGIATKKKELPTSQDTHFTHLDARLGPESFSPKLKKYLQKKQLSVAGIYSNMGLDLPQSWNSNWAKAPDLQGVLSSKFASYIRSKDVFKTLKSGGKKYRFTGQSSSIAQQLLNNNYPAIQQELANSVASYPTFYDTDANDVSKIMPSLLSKSIKNVLGKADATNLIKGFEEKSVYKLDNIAGRKKTTQEMRKYLSSGGSIYKFADAGVVTPTAGKKATTSEIIKLLGLETAAKAGGITATDVYTTLNKRTPTEAQAASKAAILAEFTKKQNRLSGAQQARTTRITSKGLLFGAAGMLGSSFSPINKKITSDQLKAPVDVRILSGIMDPAVASSVEESFNSSVNKSAGKAAKKVMIADILAKTGLGKELNLDFDRTLAFGADKILSDPKTPKFAEFGDRNKVSAALRGAKLSLLGQELSGLVSKKPELLGNLKVITARPSSTLDLVQEWLSSKGLPIPLTQFKGLGGQGVSGSQIAKLKAALLSPESLFVDDDARNIKAAKTRSKEGIQAYRYGNRKISGNSNAEATAQGVLFEKMIQKLGGPGALKGQGMDFPQGLKGAAKYFGIPGNIATDAKRTISGPSTVEDNIITYLKTQGYNRGGAIQRFADGGTPKLIQRGGFKYSLEDIIQAGFSEAQFMEQIPVPGGYGEQWKVGGFGEGSIPMPVSLKPYKAPLSVVQEKVGAATIERQNRISEALRKDGRTARDYEASSDQKAFKKMRGYATGGHVPAMVSNGETFVPPETAKAIGYSKLREMNQADRNGISSFSAGGVGVFKGPGSGTSDSIGPVSLPVGSFIIREAATKALGYRSGGAVRGIQKFNRGGTTYEAVASFDTVSAQAEKAVDDLLAKIVNQIATANPSVDFDTAYRSAEDQAVGGVSLGTRQAADLGDQNAAKAVADAQRKQVASLTRQIRATDSSVSISAAKAAAEKRVGDAWGGLYKAVQQNTQAQSRLAQTFPTTSRALGGISRGLGSIRSRIMGPSDEEVGNMSDNQRAQYENKRSRRASYMNTGLALAFAAPMAAEAAGAAVGGSTGKGVAAAGTAFGGAVAVGAQFGPWGAIAGVVAGAVLALDSFGKAVIEADIDLSKKKIETSATTAEGQLEKLNKNPRDAALTSSIVKNFKDISAEEEKISAKQAELRQPSMLTRGLETASFGMYKAARPTNEQIAEEQTANQKVGGEIALKTLTAKVESGLNIEQALSSFGGDKDLAKLNIAQTNKKFNLENQKLENIKKTPGQDPEIIATIEKRQKELVDVYFKEETATQQATVAERARVTALQQSARVLNLSSVSIAKTFENMDQAIDSATTGLDRASQRIDDIASGQVSLKTQFQSTDVLKNPNAYSQKERQAAVGQVSGMFGKDQNFVEGLSKFGSSAEDTITKIAVQAQQTGASGEVLGENITRDLTKQLIDTFGDNRISDAIREQLKGAVKDNIKNNDGVLDPQSLIDSVGGLKQLIDSQKKAFDTMMKQYAFIEKALDTYGNAVQKAAELQTQAVAKFASLQGYLADSRVSLREALGEGRRTSLSERSVGRYTEAAINAGVKPGSLTAANLTNQRNNLLNQRSAVENNTKKLENSGNLADPAVISLIAKQKDALASLNRQIEATEKGLDGLPDLIKQDLQDTLSKIGQLVQERESRTQAGASFGEKLVTSTPTELSNLNATYDLLNRTLNGQITTINQSVSAQQAYRKTIQDGGTHLEAMTAAQDAFAGDAKNAFSLFNEMIQVSGLDTTDKQRANSLRADLIQNTARSQGLNVENNPFLKEILANLRAAPKEDPQIKALENLYKQQQMALGEATQRAINPLLEKQGQILNAANTALISALDRVTNAFSGAQGRNQALGLDRPGAVMNRAQGGPVYAAGGTLVNYEPRGTDTVPAMLTPGEFVINRQATQRNLPLLKSINAGNYAKGGVVYLAGGTMDPLADTWDSTVSNYMSKYANNVRTVEEMAKTGDPAAKAWMDKYRNFIDSTRRGANSSQGALEMASNYKAPQLPTWLTKTMDGLDNLYQGAKSVGSSISSTISSAIKNPRVASTAALKYGAGAAKMAAPYVKAAAPYASKLAGPAFGAISGALADPNKTGRNRAVNTVLAATTGTGNTMGDVGARSLLGRVTGVQQGGSADRHLGNFTQLGLGTAQYMTLGLDPATAGFITAANMVTQESVGLYGDVKKMHASNNNTDRMLKNSTISSSADDPLTEFKLNVMDRRDAERLAEFNIESRRLQKGAKPRKDAVGNLMTKAFIDQQIDNIYHSLNSQDTMARPFQSDTKVNKGRGTHVDNSTFQAAVSAQEHHLERQRAESEEVRIAKIEEKKQAAQAAEDRKKEQELEKQRVQASASSSVFRMDGRDVDAATIETDTLMRGDQYGLTTAAKQGKNKVDTANRTRNQAENQRQANRWVHQPATPGPVKLKNGQTIDPNKQTQSLNKKKKDKELELDQYSFVDPSDMTEDQKKDKERLLRERDQINSEIIKLNNAIAVDVPMRERDQQWKMHGKKQEQDANKAEIASSNRANAKRFRLELAVGQAVGMGAPNKFTSPEAFTAWRGQALSKLKRKFNLTGSNKIDEKLLTQYGLSAGAAQDLFHPFTPDQAEALIQAMSQETSGGNYKYSDRDISILRMNPDQIEALALRINSGDTYLQGNMDERKKLEKAQEKTFAKLLRNFSGIENMASKGQGMNIAKQAMLKNNIAKQLTKMGYINPQNSDEENATRLAPFNLNNTVGFLYPQVAAGNAAFRSSGGMIYASEGKLINYQPRGTDTVPAMLTPGEFVVNAKATSQNLPLLQSINKNSGGVIYRAEGGGSDAFSNTTTASSAERSRSIRQTELNTRLQEQIANNTKNTASTVPTIAKTTTETANKQIPTLSNKTNSFEQSSFKAFTSLDTKTSQINKLSSTIPGFDKTANEKLDELLRRTQGLDSLIPDMSAFLVNFPNIINTLQAIQNQLAAIGAVLLQVGGLIPAPPAAPGAGAGIPIPPPAPPAGIPGGAPPPVGGAGGVGGPRGGFSKGGMVYAANGMMIPYSPRGTDTVPAMLTPGEFVVNSKATRQYLPTLQAINRAGGGKVSFKDVALDPSKDPTGISDKGSSPAYTASRLTDQIQKGQLRREQNDKASDAVGQDHTPFVSKYESAFPPVSYDVEKKFNVSSRVLSGQQSGLSNNNTGNIQLDPTDGNYGILMHELRHSAYANGGKNTRYVNVSRDALGINPRVASETYNNSRSTNILTGERIGRTATKENAEYLLDPKEIDVRLGAMSQVMREHKAKLEGEGKEVPYKNNREAFDYFMANKHLIGDDKAINEQLGAYHSDYDFYNALSEDHKDMFAMRMSELYANGGVVYAKNGMQLPDTQHRKIENYIPFKTLRDKKLAELRAANQKAQQEKAVRSRLEQGARFYINQDEMERRRKEENSPEAAQERQQRAVDRSSRSSTGSGFGSGGIQYDQQGKPYSLGGVVYAQDGFDPSRPLNPMMNRQGKGSASTLTSSPISNFNNEKLAEEAKAAGYGAAKSILPGLAGLGAGVLGLPTTGPGGFAIGLGAGAAVYQAQENYLNALAPETSKNINDTMENNWQASLLGSILGGFGVDKAGRKLLSPVMKNTPRMPTILPNSNASVRPDMKSASQEAMEEFSLRSRPSVSAPLDVPKASKTVSLFHASNTGLEDSILKSFQKEGGKSSIAGGYGQGKGLYAYTSREAAEKHARSIVKGNMLTGADVRGKPMIVKFDEALDPSKFDLDYELNAGYVTKWLYDHFDDVQKILSDQKNPMLLERMIDPGAMGREAQKGIRTSVSTTIAGTSDAIEQRATGLSPRKWIYGSQTDYTTRDGEILSKIMSAVGKRDPKLLVKFKEGFFETMPAESAIKYTGSDNLAPSNIDVLAKARGGVVYASRGTLVNYQPRGTDTVPAMLTPGEFVVNRQATQQNLPLLQSINGGVNHMSRGGMTYLSEGGIPGVSSGGISNLGQIFTTLSQSTQKFTNSLQLAISTLSDYQKQLSSGTTNSVSNNTGSNNPNMDGLSQFTNTFNKFIGQLAALNLPPQITIQGTHKVEVVINGGAAFANMQEPIQRMILGEVNVAMNKLAIQTEGVLRT